MTPICPNWRFFWIVTSPDEVLASADLTNAETELGGQPTKHKGAEISEQEGPGVCHYYYFSASTV